MSINTYMQFNKDILIIDLETTGLDSTRHEIIQLAAVLLDKKTLREKKVFNSFIKPKHWYTRSRPAMAVNKIKLSQLKSAPSLPEVISNFNSTFSKNVILTNYGGILDISFLAAAYTSCGEKYPFDYHHLDLWPLCYIYMASRKKLNNKKRFAGFSLEDISRHFKIQVPKDRHTALADCQIEAEVLRNIVKRIKFLG